MDQSMYFSLCLLTLHTVRIDTVKLNFFLLLQFRGKKRNLDQERASKKARVIIKNRSSTCIRILQRQCLQNSYNIKPRNAME